MENNINDRFIKALQIPMNGNKVHWDRKIIGFGVRITSNRSISFVLRYIFNGKERRYTIGGYPELSCISAKEKAIKLKGNILNGIDPLEIRSKNQNIITLEDLINIYLKDFKIKARKKTFIFYEDIIKRYILPNFGNKKINLITRNEIEKLHLSMNDKIHTANRILQIMSSISNYAIRQNLIKENPVQHINKYREEAREKYLSKEEIARLRNALENSKDKMNANIVKLLLLTGSRKNEVLKAKWNQFDFENNLWLKPASFTKQKKISCIPLSRQVIEILLKMKKDIQNNNSKNHIISNEEYLFFNTKTQKPLENIKRFWHNICKQAKIKDCRIHDLRHTFASILINSGENLYQTGKLMGHSNSKTTERYSHLVNKTLRHAVEKVGF